MGCADVEPDCSADGSLSASIAGAYPPGGSSDDAAEVAAGGGRVLTRTHVGRDVAEGRFRLVLDSVVEGLDDVFDDVFFEMHCTRMCMHHGCAPHHCIRNKPAQASLLSGN